MVALLAAAMVFATTPALDYPIILTDDFHVGYTHDTDNNLVHVSLRYTFFEDAEKYEICHNCDIDYKTGVRTGESGTAQQILKNESFCEKGVPCVLESFYPVGTSKFNIRAATKAGWTRWSTHRVFEIEPASTVDNSDDADPPEPIWDVDRDSNEHYPTLIPYLHIGHRHPADDTLVHLSLRHSFFAGADAYQLCVDCDIEDGYRKNKLKGTKHNFLTGPGTFCDKGPVCVREFYHRLGESTTRFNIRARNSQIWTPWSGRLLFNIGEAPGTVREATHTEL